MHKLIAATLVGALVAYMLFAAGCATSSPEKVRMGQALIFHQDGRHEAAIKEYDEVLTIRPDSPEVYFNLGQINERRGRDAEAERNYRAAIELYPTEETQKTAQAHMALGAIYFNREQFIEARSEFERAAELDPGDHRAHYNIGSVSEAMVEKHGVHNEERAIDAYRKALDLHPQFADAHLMLAFVLERRGEIEDARFHHSRARQNGRDDPLLVRRLDWWADWLDQEISARRGTGAERVEGKVVVDYPRAWTLGSAARAGMTIVRTYSNTAAIIIGRRAAMQIVGPEEVTMRDIDADMLPSEFAKGRLLEWLTRNKPDAFNAYEQWQAQLDGEFEEEHGDEVREDGEGTESDEAADHIRERGSYYGFEESGHSFGDGSSGYRIRVHYVSLDGSERVLTYYYYLGDAHSYVLVTTQEEFGDDINRTRHTLERIVYGFREETRISR